MRAHKITLSLFLALLGLTASDFNWSGGSDLVRLEVFPTTLKLHGKADLERVVVLGRYRDGSTRDLTAAATIQIADPKKIAWTKDKSRRLQALAPGKTTLNVSYRNAKTKALVEVVHAKAKPPISFQNDVMTVITRSGCNAGSCHGSAQGKNGFHLSLFGYDMAKDHTTLTREMRGRRVNTAAPAKSLMLTKPTSQVVHKGGKRFEPSSHRHEVIETWIHEGATNDVGKARSLTRLEILPSQVVIVGPQPQQFLVRAYYSDGSDRDVTELAILSSSKDDVGAIDGNGVLRSGRPGETHVLARFGTKAEVAQVLVVKDEPFAWPTNTAPRNYIDAAVFDKLRKMRLTPTPVCDDGTYLRRVFLDIVGLLPTVAETRAFLADKNPKKRVAIVDKLLQRPEFPKILAMQWAEVLRVERNRMERKGMHVYTRFLRESFEQNKPFDQLVRELLTATGSAFQNPPVNFFLVERNPRQIAESVAQNFLGIRVQCAQCHNHPFERWTMDDYYGFAAFFARVGYKRGEHPYERVVYPRFNGEMRNARTKEVSAPKFLGGEVPKIAARADRRESLAAWLTSKSNPWFARNVANRLFARFLGRGIVDPVDDVRVSNPASHPDLHRELGDRLVSYKYHLRRLIHDITSSHTYQQKASPNPAAKSLMQSYSIRRLQAEQLLTAIGQVTGVPTRFAGLPPTARAADVPDGNPGNRFLDVFGRPRRTSSCTCDRRSEPTLGQALHLINGNTIRAKLRNGKGRLRRLLAAKRPAPAILEELWLAAYSRVPTAEERDRVLGLLADSNAAEQAAIWEDTFWAVLNSKEFLFTH